VGQPEKLVQELLWHENAEITRQKYIHANRAALKRMMEEVDRQETFLTFALKIAAE